MDNSILVDLTKLYLIHIRFLMLLYFFAVNTQILFIATAFAVSCMTSMAAAQAPEEARGAVLGTLRSLGALARGIGPLVASSGLYYIIEYSIILFK